VNFPTAFPPDSSAPAADAVVEVADAVAAALRRVALQPLLRRRVPHRQLPRRPQALLLLPQRAAGVQLAVAVEDVAAAVAVAAVAAAAELRQ
jgi:hypothetical protein